MGGGGSEMARRDRSPAFHRSAPPPDCQPLPAANPCSFSQSFPLCAARTHGSCIFFSPPLSYILHRFRLRFNFFVFVFHPSRALQHGHLILPADQEKYACSGDSGGGDHYYIGIGNGGSGCSNNIVIIII
ncbi:unnamed protein product [Aphis gossypii]|uniref:Uncharacterized protein n=1 Tax=Aphis gossypii TaxID=80765 RepID=A0A9P0JEL4_APHGO|nr:unnamed protein product [Aphis gossypii]